LPEIVEDWRQLDCSTLPTLIALAKGLPDDCRQTICQLLPNCAGLIYMIYNLQLEHC